MAEGLVDWGGEPGVSGGAHDIGAPLWDETPILGKSWALPLTHPQRRIGAVPGGQWVQGIPGGVAAPILGGMGVRLVLQVTQVGAPGAVPVTHSQGRAGKPPRLNGSCFHNSAS